MQGEDHRRAKVKYDYDGTDDTQLSIKAGQTITVIGDATPEGWYLANTASGNEGYVPKDYIQLLDAAKPSAPPPNPRKKEGNRSGGGTAKRGATSYKMDMGRDDDMILEKDDTWSLFAYQMEWFAIPCIFIGATLSFMYSTPQEQTDKWRLGASSWLALVLATLATYICGYNRSKLSLCGSSAMVRAIVFFLASALLAFAYPVGIGSALVSFAAFGVELRVHTLECKELPTKVTEHWCLVMFGGTDNCPPAKYLVFFVTLAVSGGVFGWGFVDGFNFAIANNEADPSHYLNQTATAFMFGFGRVITMNLCFALLLASRDMFLICIGDHCQKNRRRGDERHIPEFLHRCFGYSIVVSSFLHLICVYFCYEDSMATHTFMDAFGWSSFITGWVALLCLAFVVAASNEMVRNRNPPLFKGGLYPAAIVLVLVLIPHGGEWLSTFYWKVIILPVVFYSLHSLINYCKNH